MRAGTLGRVARGAALAAWAALASWLAAPGALLAGEVARQAAVAPDATRSLLSLAPQVQARGASASLPPNLSRLLGLAGPSGGPVAVRQAVLRQAGDVHVYNVVAGGAARIVLFRVSGAQRRTEAFLVGEGGQLEHAVAYEGGGEAADMPADEAAAGYARETRLWLDYAGAGAGAGARR